MAVYKDDKKTKDGRCWYFIVYKKDIYGNRKQIKSKKYVTKQEAIESERLFMLKRDNPIHKPFYLIANEYLDSVSKTNKTSTSYSYIKDYKKHLEPYFKDFYIDKVNVSNINDWSLEMSKKDLSVAYLNKIYNILSNIFNYAMKHYGLESNPVKIVGRFKKNDNEVKKDKDKLRYITLDQFNKFISVVDDKVDYALFNFAFYTGCRKGEMFALKWEDIDFDTNTIKIDKTLCQKIKKNKIEDMINSPKTNENRTISMSKKLSDIMKEFKQYRMSFTDFNDSWFVFGDLLYYSQTTCDRHKHMYFELSGVPEITMHEFRHSHVSLLINEYVKSSKEKNMKVDTAKFFLMMSSRMGHTIDVMQRTYLHMFPTMQDEIVDLLDNL